MLHCAISRYIEDQINFGVYKEIIKELLQFGAERKLEDHMDRTPYQLLQSNQDRIILQDREDYLKNGVIFDELNGPEDQYRKLLFYLGYDSRENAFCCPKHAPLEKVKRS